jgi:MscS family membrane protein
MASRYGRGLLIALLAAALSGSTATHAQSAAGQPPATQPQAPVAPADSLGRATPRGTVLGFLNAARKGENELARQYLDTRLTGRAAETLAHELFVVLDARLPARLTLISDDPEGSRADPLMPHRERIGTIAGSARPIDVFVDRVERGTGNHVWLFSATTLERVPALYDEVSAQQGDRMLPGFLTRRMAGVRLVEWLALLLGIPLLYFTTVLLNRLLRPAAGFVWRHVAGQTDAMRRNALPVPVRLLLLIVVGRWLLSSLPVSLLLRQFFTTATTLVTIVAIVWLLMLLGAEIEGYIHRQFPRSNSAAASSLLRVLRRTVDVLVVFIALLLVLRYFGVDPTPALAGLGVGGIAVALAAQKTLENVIAGASLIFDQAVRVGDTLKVGEITGTVDHIGLRSTRMRTPDRTVVSIPNSQIANASLETLSARDKFWFHPVVGLRYETSPEQLRAVLDGLRRLLETHPSVDPESVRVRFVRLGAFSLDIELFAYLFASDWNRFLEMQEDLLLNVTEIVRRAGTEIAFPSQTMYVNSGIPEVLRPPEVQR